MAKQKNPYEIDFEEYIRHTDASKKEKTLAWSTAIGLQQVDGLTPSSYLYATFLLTKQKNLSIHIIKKRLREIQMKTNERKKPIK